MQFISVILLVSLSLFSSTKVLVRTPNKVSAAKIAIQKLINSVQIDEERPLIAAFVRLSFHDCVGEGGCDGCIDHNNPNNAGLQRITHLLEPLHNKEFANDITLADFYVLASMTALEMATEKTPDKFLGFSKLKLGRNNCEQSPKEDDDKEVFPSSDLTVEDIVNYFTTHFDFNPRETIALLGAHTLGKARTENSGYEGTWVRGPGAASRLDNAYYAGMVNRPWVQVQVEESKKFQWQIDPRLPKRVTPYSAANRGSGQRSMMLNADSALFVDLDLDANGQASCIMCASARPPSPSHRCCVQHRYSDITASFAKNNALWLKEFTDVFIKMINRNTAFDRVETHQQ